MTQTSSILIKDTIILSDTIKKGSVLIVDNKIQEIGNNLTNRDAQKVIDGSGKIAMPGLVNTHSHIAMTLLRGVGEDTSLQAWLNEHIWPREAKLTEELVYLGSMLAIAEMIKTGTTTFNDMYFFMDETAKAVEKSGIRSVLGYGMIDLFDEEKRKSELKVAKDLFENHHNTADSRVQIAIAPHSPYTCSEELLRESKEIAQKHDLKYHIHVAETKQETEDVKSDTNMTPFEYLDNIGVLDNNTIAAHGVWTTDKEMKILKQNNVSISHNPLSNMKLASGIAPVNEYLVNGINVSIGTDGASSNNNLDMFSEMKAAALLQKVNLLDPEVLPVNSVIEMATLNGAKALGIDAGVISEEKLADIILVDTFVPHMRPLRDVKSNIVYSALGTDTDTVICNGQILLENKQLTTINEQEIIEDVSDAYKKLD